MWFHRAKDKDKQYPFPGVAGALDGHRAAYATERMAGDAVVLHAVADLTEDVFQRLVPVTSPGARVSHAADPSEALATAVGQALAGLRASAMVVGLRGMQDNLSATAGKRLPIVLHLTTRARARQAGALHGGHDDYYAAADTGWFQLFAKDVQEVSDFALIAHRAAELSLTPGMCAQDLYGTSHAVQSLWLPEVELIARYLGHAGDAIESHSEAQKILFGANRRRIPLWLDPDHPAGIGGVQDRDSYFKGVVSAGVFFAGDLGRMLDEAMREFGELTGRYYERFCSYRAEDADVVVLAQGAVIDQLRPVVDYLRDSDMIKAGIINLSVLRPFPGARLSHLLKGKKVVTVLERSDGALGEDPPIMRDVRAAVDKAAENGAASRKIPLRADYATYVRPEDRPLLFSGVYGVGRELPDFAELLAVYRNMLPGGKAKTRFYLGAGFEQDTRRFPQLQMLQQRLNRAYPGLQALSLAGAAVPALPKRRERAVQLLSLSAQGGLFAGNLVAQALAESLGWNVRTFPEGGLEASLQPTVLTLTHATDGGENGAQPIGVDTVLVSDDRLIKQLASRSVVNAGGTVIVGSARTPEALWRDFSNRTAQWIQDAELRFHVIDAQKIASETATRPTFVDQLMIWSLLGGWLKAGEGLSDADLDGVGERLRAQLEILFGAGDERVADVVNAMRRGGRELQHGDWGAWDVERPVRPEVEAPSVARSAARDDEAVFDPTRFWRSVGFLYDNGQAEYALNDPFVATGILPARSSEARDMTPYRLRIPHWLPENCTGCGECWTQCPESALPPSLHTVSGILDAAINECARGGAAIVQLRRVGDPLAKQAYQLLAKNGLHGYRTVGPLLQDAFERLVEKMKITGDPLAVLTAEFDLVRANVDDYGIAKTECFFDELHQKEKGGGRLLSIALNPLSCTGCGICIEECPDGALEWGEQDPATLEGLRQNRERQQRLPAETSTFVATLVSPSDPRTETRRLLDGTAYGSLVGGDGSYPGNAAKTAVHLVTATVESVMGPRFQTHVERLSSLIERIEAKIQGDVEAVIKINDFDDFTQRLNRFARKELTPEALGNLLGGNGEPRGLDPERLKRLGDLLAALKEQRRSYIDGAGGTGRSRMVMAIDGHDGPFWSGTYPYNPHRHPWVYHLPGEAPTVAAGVLDGITRKLAVEMAACRRAELELNDDYLPAEHDAFFAAFGRDDFTDAEWALLPPVIVVGSDECTRWADVSRLIAAGHPVKVVIIDTKVASIIEGSSDIAMMAMEQGGAFVLQSGVGHPGHLMRGVAEGLDHHRPAVLRVYAPDPQAGGIAPEKVAAQARLAYQSRTFPLYTFDPDRDGPKLTLEENPDANDTWAVRELVSKDPSGSEARLKTPLTTADWALGEGRFRRFFKTVSKGNLNEQMKELAAYIELAAGEREGQTPFVHAVDAAGRHVLAIVSPEIVRATERGAASWRRLCDAVASGEPGRATPSAAEAPAAPAASEPRPGDVAAYEQVTRRLLELAGYGRDTDFFKRSLREFVTENREGAEE